jgi:lipoprotein-anchoring transpeptidase ErfK/SrfK
MQHASPHADTSCMGHLPRARTIVLALTAFLIALAGSPPGAAVDARAATAVSKTSAALRLGHAPAHAERAVASAVEPAVVEPERQTGHLLVEVTRPMRVTARPGGGRVVGTMPEGSRFYDQPIVAWVIDVSDDGRFGLVPVPYAGADVAGWIPLRGLEQRATHIEVRVDLSEHRIVVLRGDRVLFRAPAATGTAVSPTPVGNYFVTDRVAFPSGGSLGTFAFGISGIQTDLPPGWSGGDQLAIHGTNAPGTIGTSASAGCLRVSEQALERLRPLLRPGTPVIVVR